MHIIKGTFENGTITLQEKPPMDKCTEVIVTFMEADGREVRHAGGLHFDESLNHLNQKVMEPDDIRFQVGQMIKYPTSMTKPEKARWEKQVAEDARKYLFSINQPVVYQNEEGQIVAEYEDGRILFVR